MGALKKISGPVFGAERRRSKAWAGEAQVERRAAPAFAILRPAWAGEAQALFLGRSRARRRTRPHRANAPVWMELKKKPGGRPGFSRERVDS